MTAMKPILLKNPTSLSEGLSTQQLEGKPRNIQNFQNTRSLRSIIRKNVFTYFNLLNFILFGLVLLTGSIQNGLFMGVVLANLLIGLVQEIRSKKVLDHLALLHQQKYTVRRNGKSVQADMDQIVQGDLVQLQAGLQVPCDGVIRQGQCDVNESMLTGESDALTRKEGDSLYAGCFIVSGMVWMQAVLVGESTYMASILEQTRQEKRYPSKLRDSLNAIIRFSSWILAPAGVLLFIKLFVFSHQSLNQTILSVVAALVGMIPEGLIILTSIALAAASVKLAKKEVLVQELYCIENLARVDVLCLDKTGTITSGAMQVSRLVPENGQSEEQMKSQLAKLYSALEDDNVTAKALRSYLDVKAGSLVPDQLFPFSSASKCAGARFGDQTLIAGAYSFIFEKEDPAVLKTIDDYARQGLRVLAFAQAGKLDKLQKGNCTLLGLVVIEDEIRPDAPEILGYFKKQGVQLKVISGDMPQTVQAIAAKAGLQGKAIDMSRVSKEDLPKIMEEYSIFGRVTPFQKKDMVEALQNAHHTVAMTGDGVNDVMALRQADCSIAMGSGAQAARSVASLVLLEDQFSALPGIVNEGRRVINNIQRTASLFLVKTLFSFGLSILTLLWLQDYPFVPIQLTVVSFFGTGLPGFLLTFEPNYSRVEGDFLVHVLSRALPGAIALVSSIVLIAIARSTGLISMNVQMYQTFCTFAAGANAMGVLVLVCCPLNLLRRVLVISMAVLFGASVVLLSKVLMLTPLSLVQFAWAMGFCVLDWLMLAGLAKIHWQPLLADSLLLKAMSRPGPLEKKQKKLQKKQAGN